MQTQRYFDSDDGSRNVVIGNSIKMLRPVFKRTFAKITNGAELRATLRNGQFAWPGGYQMYLITSDGECLSFDAVKDNLREVLSAIRAKDNSGWRVVGCDINYEDSDMVCAHTGKPIPAAYGDE